MLYIAASCNASVYTVCNAQLIDTVSTPISLNVHRAVYTQRWLKPMPEGVVFSVLVCDFDIKQSAFAVLCYQAQ